MSDWMERCAAITGLFYGFDTTRVLQEKLKPGDVFLDIGGNLGFLSLTASALVGEAGRVIYAEPNPALAARFRASLGRNAIRNVEVIEAAIGEHEGETALNVAVHHGKSQLAEGTGIRMVTGDSLLPLVPEAAPLFVKIDVEGYEERILHGMPVIRARLNTMFLVEITDAWLRERGGSAKSLIDMMLREGFSAFHASLSHRCELELPEIRAPLPLKQYDLLFARAPRYSPPTAHPHATGNDCA